MFKESKMKTDVQKVSACRVKCVVEATAAEIDPIYQQVRAGFTKQVKMPGFRPGKAPWERIEALYGKQIQEEVNQRVISTLYREVLKDESLKVETLVDIAAIRSAKGQGAEATFVVDLKPEFKTPDTAKWQVKKLDDAVTEEEVEERLAGARRMLASYVDASAEDTATQNDLVAIAFTSDLDAATLSDAAKHYAADEEYWVQLQEDAFIPGLVGALLGKKLEETTQLTATYPADYRVTDLAGKTVNYNITLKKMRKQQAVDDETLVSRMGAQSLDDLRTKMRENIALYKKSAEQGRAAREIADAIAASVSFDLPERVVENRVYDILSADKSKPLEMFKGDSEALKKSDVYKQAVKTATDSTRRHYVLTQLADERKITLSQEDTKEAIEALAAQVQLKPEELVKRLHDNGRLDDFLSDARANKVLTALIDECAVK